MIASIEGLIASRRDASIVLEVGGLGIEVFVTTQTLHGAGNTGDTIRLFTYLHVREDALSLFGFKHEKEREMFLFLIGISGIGPRVAMGILSAAEPEEIARSIHNGDAGRLLALPGVGKKTAERIVLELKDKIDYSLYRGIPSGDSGILDRELAEEALAALISIGLTRVSAERALDRITPSEMGEQYGVEDLVREALKKVST